jgi:hypothetical protein
MADTVDLTIAALVAERLSQGGLHLPERQAPDERAITRDSNALVLVTWLPNRREAKASLAPRSLGRPARPAQR